MHTAFNGTCFVRKAAVCLQRKEKKACKLTFSVDTSDISICSRHKENNENNTVNDG